MLAHSGEHCAQTTNAMPAGFFAVVTSMALFCLLVYWLMRKPGVWDTLAAPMNAALARFGLGGNAAPDDGSSSSSSSEDDDDGGGAPPRRAVPRRSRTKKVLSHE
jgi:hypothetical protein